jgi:HEAT repeat protein
VKAGDAGAGIVPELTALLGASDWQTQRAAAETLKNLGPAARTAMNPVAGLMESAVKNEEAERAGLLFAVLEKMGPDGVTAAEPHLLTGLATRTDPMLAVAVTRVKMLSKEGRAKAVPILVGHAGKHGDRHGRLALEALSLLGADAKSASDALLGILREKLKTDPLGKDPERFVEALRNTLFAFDRGLGATADAEIKAARQNAQEGTKP